MLPFFFGFFYWTEHFRPSSPPHTDHALLHRLGLPLPEHWQLRADVGARGSLDGGRDGDQLRLLASRAAGHDQRRAVPEHGTPPPVLRKHKPSRPAARVRHTISTWTSVRNRPLCTTSAPSMLLARPAPQAPLRHAPYHDRTLTPERLPATRRCTRPSSRVSWARWCPPT